MKRGENCSKETRWKKSKQVTQSWRQWTRVGRGVYCSVIWNPPANRDYNIIFLASLWHCVCVSIFVPVVSLLSCLLLAGFAVFILLFLDYSCVTAESGGNIKTALLSCFCLCLGFNVVADPLKNQDTEEHTMFFGFRVCFVLQGEIFGGQVDVSTWAEIGSKVASSQLQCNVHIEKYQSVSSEHKRNPTAIQTQICWFVLLLTPLCIPFSRHYIIKLFSACV